MDWTAVGLVVTVVVAVGGSSWHLAGQIAASRRAVTDAIHGLDVRLTTLEAQPHIPSRVAALERRVDRLAVLCPKCEEER